MSQRVKTLCGAGIAGVASIMLWASAHASPSDLLLEGPSLETWKPDIGPGSPGVSAATPRSADGDSVLLEVTAFEVELFPSPGARHAIGAARMGARLPGTPAEGRGCQGGTWYRVSGGAYLCTAEGAVVSGTSSPGRHAPDQPEWVPAYDEPNPVLYARVIKDRAPRLRALPSAAQAEALDAGKSVDDLVERSMRGDYFLALARKLTHEGRTYYKTVLGRFVRAEDLELKPVPPIRGEQLGGKVELPLAFALDDTPILCDEQGALKQCGTMKKHARMPAGGVVTRGGARYVRGPDGIVVSADAVRVAEAVSRPKDVPEGAKWVHVHLTSQTLVAYEGDTPVYVTLVSSGRDGYHTPGGVFQVQRKYLTKTMRGRDDVTGMYEVQEVPWTLFYDGNYAIHGAYWHNLFGRTKSHGCVNVPPVDARWLYYWSTLDLPEGWHSMYHRRGTYVYISGKTPPDGK